ncbi:MAG TPA: choice-of-anchor R domain-containing protein [Terriglobales bacterium]|nr:choice-of-anchor R domain-containing protein [Terriglobales bacterium]
MKTFTPVLLCVGMLALTCGTLAAEDAQRSPQLGIAQRSPVVREADAPPAGLKTIFTNLGSKTDAYDDGTGYYVAGTSSTAEPYQWIANPFTPAKNSTVKEIEIALVYDNSGTNAAEVALYSDASGLPGKALESWDVKNLPISGTCCKLVKVISKKGIKIKKGTQYWVVGKTDKKSATSTDLWDFVYNQAVGPIAFISAATSNKWTLYSAGSTQAFAVFGTE